MNQKSQALGIGLDALFRLSNSSDAPQLEHVRSVSVRAMGTRIELAVECAAAVEGSIGAIRDLSPVLAGAWGAFEECLESLDRGELAKARHFGELAVSRFDRCADFHYTLGLIYDAMGYATKASHAFGRALEIDPHDADTWVNYGALMYSVGNVSAARTALLEALSIDPAHSLANENWKLIHA